MVDIHIRKSEFKNKHIEFGKLMEELLNKFGDNLKEFCLFLDKKFNENDNNEDILSALITSLHKTP